MLELARLDAEDLAGRIDWDALVKEQTFVTIAGSDQPGAIPSDFGRFPFRKDDRGELYDVRRREGIAGPASDNQWRRLDNFTGWTSSYRIMGGLLMMRPPPGAGLTIGFTYVSKNLFVSTGGVTSDDWNADSDICLIPERLIILGVVWRWKQAKGFEYAEDLRTAEMEIEKMAGTTRGRRMLTIGSSRLRADDYAFSGVLGGSTYPDITGQF